MLGGNTVSLNQEKNLINADVYQYNTLSDGIKKVYTNDDELIQYGNRGILDPNDVSYFGLFINGVLQPKVNYEIQKGLLVLKTEDVPIKDSTIILSFITFEDKSETSAKLNSALVEGLLPSGVISSGPVTDAAIRVRDNISDYLHLESTLLCGPACISSGCGGIWDFSLTIRNVSSVPVTDIVMTGTILLDSITHTQNTSVSCGNVWIQDGVIIWGIDTLNPYESATANFRAEGFFQAQGVRCIGRSMACGNTGIDSVSTDIICITPVHVCQGLNPAESYKVISRCEHTVSFENICIDIEKPRFCDILFKPGLIMKNTLNITDIENSPNLKRVQFLMTIPIVITTEAMKRCYLTDAAAIDVIMSIPASGEDFYFDIEAETYSAISNAPVISNTNLDFSIHVFMIIRAVSKASVCSRSCLHRNDCPGAPGNLTIEKYIVSGPLEIHADAIHTWRVEIRISNDGYGPVNHVVMTDTLLLDDLVSFNPISFTKGTVSQQNNIITWDIGTLHSKNTVVLLAEITGSFRQKHNKILDVSTYQYNTISNGIKKEFTNTDELLLYGNDGIPDPNNVSFFNLFINGVLQPETNYSVEPGLLTLTIAEPPKENAPIILEYLVIKDRDNQLVKAETYQYNTLSNGERTYTDADELTVYGDRGILDPNQTSYNHLFVNGVLQPSINYTIQPGILTLTVAYAPMEGAPILVKFISLYL